MEKLSKFLKKKGRNNFKTRNRYNSLKLFILEFLRLCILSSKRVEFISFIVHIFHLISQTIEAENPYGVV